MNVVFLLIIFMQISVYQCDKTMEKEGEIRKFQNLDKRQKPVIPEGYHTGGPFKSAGNALCRSQWCDQAVQCWKSGVSRCCVPPREDYPECYEYKCFPVTVKVNLENGKSVAMSELRVQTGDGYSEVRMFMKKQHTTRAMYIAITTSLNETIHLSSEHLIYARASSTNQFNAISAEKISIGNEVLVQANFGLINAEVINVSRLMMQGAFTPLTMDDNIVVNQILASCYAYSDHDLAHMGMTPFHWFPKVTEWIFGMDNESPACVNVADDFARFVLPFELASKIK